MTRVLPAGKLPNDQLHQLLRHLMGNDSTVVIGPGVGEDAAVIDAVAEDECLILKTDPITFASDRIGYYAVHVNANDIAASGGTPRWFLTTLLLPCGSSLQDATDIGRQVADTAKHIGVSVCGGHTEITSAVTRPVVCGTMAGTVKREGVKNKADVRTGQVIVMTKTAGNEGTAILAREYADLLESRGVDRQAIRAGAEFLDRISVLPEAGLAGTEVSVSAMHDVTEGGVATALREMVHPSGHGLRVFLGSVSVAQVTTELCAAAELDPLGLIGSGSLLIAIDSPVADQFVGKLIEAGIPAAVVAKVTARGGEIMAVRADGRSGPLSNFARDEIARLG